MTTETKTITLDAPFKRGEKDIKQVTLRRPQPGEMRGLKVQDIIDGDVQAVILLLSRTSDLVSRAEAEALDLTDFATIATEIALFFAPKAAREQLK